MAPRSRTPHIAHVPSELHWPDRQTQILSCPHKVPPPHLSGSCPPDYNQTTARIQIDLAAGEVSHGSLDSPATLASTVKL
ncbi:hypothetical protein TWF718_003211 [Orbilia javanica]|uniref:Uncharacterized protein n=1 Tax=Orbilia javanica TaxID=47235 RepID=A0AAN8MPZ9_9PEZI